LLCSIARADSPVPSPRFVGSQTCSTSGCHGGATLNRDQSIVWAKKDFHSRSYATLTIARSQRIAETLHIGDPTQSPRCTVCHAPFQTVPEPQRAPAVAIAEGVSCENCHGAGQSWLRAHTRPDYTYADRVTVGMRDLKSLYVRANTCVACHQNVDAELLRAGHPELIFELDGQSVSEPKHWRERKDSSGAQTWFVGQAVALREMSWQLERESQPDDRMKARWSGLLWVLQKTGELDAATASPEDVQHKCDELAIRTAAGSWSADRPRTLLATLASSGSAFTDASVPREVQARRAERLVLALDRLAGSLSTDPAIAGSRPELYRLFDLIQSLPDFDPQKFAQALQQFDSKLTSANSGK
jgi:cytochrome c554/c'-like protein